MGLAIRGRIGRSVEGWLVDRKIMTSYASAERIDLVFHEEQH